jgi:plasmid stability protein
MGTITIRNLDEETIERIKRQAEMSGRSMEAEIRTLLKRAVKPTLEESRALLEKRLEEEFGNRVLADSSPLIREDRDR